MTRDVRITREPNITFHSDDAVEDMTGTVVIAGAHGKILCDVSVFLVEGNPERSSEGQLNEVYAFNNQVKLVGFTSFSYIKNNSKNPVFSRRKHKWKLARAFRSRDELYEWFRDFLLDEPEKRYHRAFFDTTEDTPHSDVTRVKQAENRELGFTDSQIQAYVLYTIHGHDSPEVAAMIGEDIETVQELVSEAQGKMTAATELVHTLSLIDN